MASSSVTARRYFQALNAHDLDAATHCWQPGAVDRVAGEELGAPAGVQAYLAALVSAFPDLGLEVLDTTTQRERCVVRWRLTGTFAGPGRFRGLAPNGARIAIEGCDLIRVRDDQIIGGEVFLDGAEVARQLGVLPGAGSRGQTRLTTIANLRTVARRLLSGAEAELIAPGVWLLRGGRPRAMNVYLIEDEGGVTVFDAGVCAMSGAIRAAAARLGGIRRVILGHADCDHRGGAAGLEAPVYCHPGERSAAQTASAFRDYWDLRRLARFPRLAYPRLMPRWDGGALEVAGTVEEGEQVAGFRVLHLPGHAPGLIGLIRDEDGLALVSDCLYTLNVETGLKVAPTVPHRAFNLDTDQARDSIRKLAAERPSVVWPGHAAAVSGDDVELQLLRAAVAAV